MDRLMDTVAAFARSEEGATAVEYGLLAALFSVACIVAFLTVGGGIGALFGATDSGVGGAMRSAAGTIQ